MKDLPMKVFECVLGYLPVDPGAQNLGLVCRSWRESVNTIRSPEALRSCPLATLHLAKSPALGIPPTSVQEGEALIVKPSTIPGWF